VTIDADLIAAA
jgi:hypothetical protein